MPPSSNSLALSGLRGELLGIKKVSEPASEFFLLSVFAFSLLPPLLFFPRLTLIDLRESVPCEVEDSPKSRRTTLRLFCWSFSSAVDEDDDLDVWAAGMSKSMRLGEGDFWTFLGGLGGGCWVVSAARGNSVGVGDLDE